MTGGVTEFGFDRKTQEELQVELEESLKAAFTGLNVKVGAIQQIAGIISDRLGLIWEALEDVYGAFYPSSATGASLENTSLLSGTRRLGATKSTVTGTVNLDAGTTLPIGSIAAVDGNPDARFVTTEEVTNAGPSAADVTVETEAETAGAVAANAGSLTVKVSAVSGWNTITNPLDADIGTEIELDPALRLRRAQDVASPGGSSPDALLADLLDLDDVTEVTVFSNRTDFTDGDGVPPHSFEALVRGGDDAVIFQEIWDEHPTGIESFGSTSGSAVDKKGKTQSVAFSRPTEREVFLIIALDRTNDYPLDGNELVKTAVAQFGSSTYKTGSDVVLSKLNVPICSVAGVQDITEIKAGFSASPTGTVNLVLAARELALLDTSRIVVNSTPV